MSPTTTSTSGYKVLSAVVAIILLGIYIYALVVLWGGTGTTAEEWARRISILGGIEALAFAAAGWLFGRDVSRQTIDQANERAAEANRNASGEKQRADVAQSDAIAAATELAAARSIGGLEGVRQGAVDPHEILRRYGVAGY
jgi:hypothetical protein